MNVFHREVSPPCPAPPAPPPKEERIKKTEWTLLPMAALEEIAAVLTHQKRAHPGGPRDWEKGRPYGATLDGVYRHLAKWWEGEDNDPGTGKSHLAHAGARILFLLWYSKKNMKKHDDRPKRSSDEKV